ncbi:MAG TPA: DUF4203 domain-containing protein [Candidatus Binatia bacterium]|jgi:hypothetical protein|nr:DUF4203 domain-containing protein [Candidatus Binatia bacterium]
MKTYAWSGQITAPLAVALGILICFWGYRILKLTLGIMGFMAGAAAGWSLGLALAPGNNAIALICAVIAGAIGAALCVWLFFLGIFLLGASAGAVVAAALFTAAGNQPQPILLLAFAGVFGVIALVLQKLMITLSTASSGSYLITAGIFQFFTGAQPLSLLWFDRLHPGSAGVLSYAALALWLVLAVSGLRFQYRGRRKKEEAARKEGPA